MVNHRGPKFSINFDCFLQNSFDLSKCIQLKMKKDDVSRVMRIQWLDGRVNKKNFSLNFNLVRLRLVHTNLPLFAVHGCT